MKTPFGTGSCCPPAADGVTYLKVGPDQQTTGMLKLEVVFQQLYQESHHPEEMSDDQLLWTARQYNYIPPKKDIETEYAIALRRAYTSYYSNKEKTQTIQREKTLMAEDND